MSDAWAGIVGAAVGGVIGVLGTILNPYLSSRAKRRDDRRSESLTAARAAHAAVLTLEDDFQRRVLLRLSDDEPRQNDPAYHALRREFGSQVSLIDDPQLRRRLDELNYLLSDLTLERDSMSPFSYGSRIAEHASELLSTYLRGDALPAAPEHIALWNRHIRQRDEIYEEEWQEILAMREEEAARARGDESQPPF